MTRNFLVRNIFKCPLALALVGVWVNLAESQYPSYSFGQYIYTNRLEPLERGKFRINILGINALGTLWDSGAVYTDQDSALPGRGRSFAVDQYISLNYAFSDIFSMGVTIPYYWDMWETERLDGQEVRNWESHGPGDFRVDFTLLLRPGRNSLLGVIPFITLPMGDQQSYDPHGRRVWRKSPRGQRVYKGGLWRDFTTQSIDYGVDFSYLQEVGKRAELGAHLTLYNPYQVYFMDQKYNGIGLGVSLAYKLTRKIDFLAEGYTFQYSGYLRGVKKWGSLPVFVNLGLDWEIFRGLKLKLGGVFPVTERDSTPFLDLPRVWKDPSFPYKFRGTFPFINPSYGMKINLSYTGLFKEYEKGDLIVKVVEGKTGNPIEGASVLIDFGQGVTDLNGIVSFVGLNPEIYEIKVSFEGYEPGVAFALVEPRKTTEKIIKLYRFEDFEATLKGKVIDAKTGEPIPGATIQFPGTKVLAIQTDSKGEFNTKTGSGVYTLRISKENYHSEVFTVYMSPGYVVNITVPLDKEVPTAGIMPLPYIYFDFDKYRVKREYYPLIDFVAEILKQDPRTGLEIYGHCSSPASDQYNIKLGQRRAEAVKEYLVLRHRIAPERIRTISKGESELAVKPERKTTYFGLRDTYFMNQRVEFRIVR